MKIAVVGAGWAGLAAAVQACRNGHAVTVYEAARTAGGRARTMESGGVDGSAPDLDNGQHILVGAYTETLALMKTLGVDPDAVLLRTPLDLRFADGTGLALPDLAPPWDVLAGVLALQSWPLRERLQLLRTAWAWRRRGFACDASLTVGQLCRHLGPAVMAGLIDPLCVSALNTPSDRASAQVFLRVMQDALFAGRGGSHLLLPRTDLGRLLPGPALQWLQSRGVRLRLGTRVGRVAPVAQGWQLDVADDACDAVVVATSSTEAARLCAPVNESWSCTAAALEFEAIATVYARGVAVRLPSPMVALRPSAQEPAQFVLDRGQLGGAEGLLAFVVSASSGDRAEIQSRVLEQARRQLGLQLEAVQTVVEKRATFACTPALRRPPAAIAPRLVACGDYVAGPYPATLEGAVRSGLASVQALT